MNDDKKYLEAIWMIGHLMLQKEKLARALENAIDLAGSGNMPHPDELNNWKDILEQEQ